MSAVAFTDAAAASAPGVLAREASEAPPRETHGGLLRESLPLRMLAFFALATLAGLQYADLVTNAPAGRVVAVAAVATAACGLIAAGPGARSGVLGRAWRVLVPGTAWRVLVLGTAWRVLALALALAATMLVLGVPAHLLQPGGWESLGGHIGDGVRGLERWLWPYRGADAWARLTVLLVFPVVLLLAGALWFWPARSHSPLRGTAALLLLLALFLTGAANAPAPAPALRGVLLLALVAVWLWLPGMRRGELARAGRWLLVCSALALLAEPVLTSPDPWIDYRDGAAVAGGGTSFEWDQLYGPIPWSRSTVTLFDLSSPRPTLLRVTSLDRFDGLRFLRSAAAPGALALDLPGRPAQRPREGRVTVQLVELRALRSRQLVGGAGVTLAARWLGGRALPVTREADGTLSTAAIPRHGALYSVTSYVADATPARLRAAPRTFPAAYLPYAQFELPSPSASALVPPDLAGEARAPMSSASLVGPAAPGGLPAAGPGDLARIDSSPYAPMFSLARRLAAGAGSSYDIALRIEQYLRRNYAYDEHVPLARYPLEAFLFQQRRGYCEQFSGAMTLLLRMDGIPARVAAGFKPALYDPVAGSWKVRPLDAHAWVEVFFSGIGWVPFDPTPEHAVRLTALERSLSRSAAQAGGHVARPGAGTRARGGGTGDGRSGGGVGLAGAVGIALAVVCFATLATLHGVGRRRLRRVLSSDSGAALDELRWALGRLGVAPATTHAPLEGRRGSVRPTRGGRAALRRALSGGAGYRARLRALLALPPAMTRRGASPAASGGPREATG